MAEEIVNGSVEINSNHKKSQTWERVFWGIVFLAAAVLIILYATGVNLGVVAEIPVIDLILGVILVAWIIARLVKVDIPGIFLPLGLLFCIFEDEIAVWTGKIALADKAAFVHGSLLNHWIVLLIVVLLTAGTALLLRPLRLKRKQADGNCRVNHGSSSTVYIDCQSFTAQSVKNELGSTNVWFSNKENYAGGGVLTVQNELGATIIHVPKEWQIACNVSKDLGSVTVPGTGTPGGKLLTITGHCDLGSVAVRDDG